MYDIIGLGKGGKPKTTRPKTPIKRSKAKQKQLAGIKKAKKEKTYEQQSSRNQQGKEDFLTGRISAEDRRNQLERLAKSASKAGIPFALDPEEFTGNKRGISNAIAAGKLREGMTGAEYHEYMSRLHGHNPAAMEKAFPWGSGKGLRSLANLAVPAPLKMLGAMAGDMGTAAKQGLTKAFPGPAKDLGSEWERFSSNLPWNRKKNEKISETLEMITDPSQNIYDIQPESENIFNEDTANAILEDLLESLDTSQNIAYAPKRIDDPLRNSLAAHRDVSLSGYYPTNMASASSPYETGASWYDPDEDEEPGEWGEGIDWDYNYPGGSKAFETEDWLGEIQPKLDAIKEQQQEERLNELLDVFDSRRLGLGEGPLTYGEPKANLPRFISSDLLDLMEVPPFDQGGLASLDPYRGTMGGGMNPSGWSPDPTVRSVTGYQNGGLMNNGNPVDYHNLRNTNKYYGSF